MFRPLRPLQIAADMIVAALFVVILGPPEFGASVGTAPAGFVLGFVVCWMLGAALAVRRLSPAVALGIAWAAAIVQMAGDLGPRPSDVAIFAVLYVTAAYGTRLVFWLGFASALLGAVVITGYMFFAPAQGGGGTGWQDLPTALFVLIAAGFALLLSWTVGALARTAWRAQESRRARDEAERARLAEQERGRIARDMHDVVAHSLAVIVAQADGARYAAASDAQAAPAALATIAGTARGALADVRLLLTQLRHAEGAGPQPTLTDLEALYAQVRHAGVGLRVDVDPAPAAAPPASLQLAVYRIVQEALTNALRHGGGAPVDVSLAWWRDAVDVVVRNAAPIREMRGATEGHGLIGMRERAHLVGGTLSARQEDGFFVVRARLPLGGGA
ncbi:histidine kinase [Microbacterium sp. LRZ72]|uniref:sensor histidine kinase n=1 Tax=Microbacterium sp. LRZ72 TaxID=2942481 RepID=UPI0029BD4E49|nr:histidine kinase [Microbacterium sp. LRZ72]MDX2376669.1 histidine kinase [Microbacterium sp. LRZ72]